MKPVAIIMPVHNSGRFMPIAVNSIFESTNYPFKLFLIESESTDGTAESCDALAKAFPDKVEVHHIPKRGLVPAINYAIKVTDDLDVYLTQDDCIHHKLFERDWLESLVAFSKLPNAGAVATMMAGGKSGPSYIDGLDWVGTWSTFILRETINKVGWFDENLGPGDDIDYSYRIYQAGLRIYMCDFWVEHHRKTEHGDADSEAKIKLMSERFKKKWGIK
jgi:O-antigen biosynthesis protein